ncbi:MAG TPA: magnesium-translocating P-type ATPase [Blastocatellia bacterium]|jgi:Mg2+-importing ATPase|nr:magnesium-translocating P-type ATPase [Blastocatellia bacterium]HCX30002.1 magnesium-translocating P-type ATPase [Blastocatellia bacterium]
MQPTPNSTFTTGLTSREARQRLAEFGPNEPVSSRRTSGLTQILFLFINPLAIILLIASGISAAVGEVLNASIIALMVLLSAALNFFQTYRSQRAVERIRQEVAPAANVLRDGNWTAIPRRELVPGDVIGLTAGDLVPADAWLFKVRDLHVQQAALTGESLPVEKDALDLQSLEQAKGDERHKVFLGTSVVSGTGTAQVMATGKNTSFGDIATRLATKPPETEFERGTRQFGLLIMKTTILLVLFVLLVSVVLHHNFLESLLFAVALAVGLTPEFLPMITTVTLGQGAVHMARKKVIVKHLEAMQNFGSIDVLCSDKTGTLTSGEMALDQHLDLFGSPSERVFLLAYLNSLHETGVSNPLDQAIKNQASKQKPGVNPLDEAVLQHDHPDIHAYRKIDEIPFDFERRRVSIVVEREAERLLITKGAPESVLPVCSRYELNGQQAPLDADSRARGEATYRDLCARGFRVLAVAYAAVPLQEVYRADDEKDLVLAGFLTFSDPPLDTAKFALEALRRDGVEVKILTGDNELVTRHICAQVGLIDGRIILGDELERMSDPALAHVVERTSVFARVSPAQKNRIILALKVRRHVVGYLGDGINDAPSLHAADVGISVSTAVDVARDAADIILLERSLSVLHEGIIEGRKAFGNVMKYLLMGTSSNFGNMFSMAVASLFLPFLPMLPTQILLNNFLYDLAQVTIPTDHVDITFIHKPQRWNVQMIRDFMIYIGPLSSIYDFLTFFALLKVFHASEQLFHTGWFVESLATQTLVIFIIRTAGNPLRSRPSLALTATTIAVVMAGIAIPFTSLGKVLGFVRLPFAFFLFLAGASGTYLLLVELVKRRLMRRLLG